MEQLRAATEALDAAMVVRVDNSRRMVQAAAAAKIQVTRAISVLGVLDGAIVTALPDNAELLAAWRNARRVTTVPSPGTSLDSAGAAALNVA